MAITLKEFVIDEAARRSVGTHTVYKDIGRDKYPSLKLKRKNARVVFVVNKILDFVPTFKPTRRHPKQVFI